MASSHSAKVGLVTAIATLVVALGWAGAECWQRAQAVVLPDAPSDRIQCVSYAPFRMPGHTPFDKSLVITPEQIDADLAALARISKCVRTYSVDQGLSEVPRLARKHGLEVLLGLWIGRDGAKNEQEIAHGLTVIARDRDAIRAVIVGNEVLLRREQPPDVLRGYITRVRDATGMPVTYADVWEFWTRHRALADAVSFVTVHILPYWEDEPIAVDTAVKHILDIHATVGLTFVGKEILIGETGWPSAGRNRAGAQPGRIEQARFVREFLTQAEPRGIRYNLIEAVDQPWKRALEGTVGGHWGLLDPTLTAKFPLQGPIPAPTFALTSASTRALALVIGAVIGLALGHLHPASRLRRMIVMLSVSVAGYLLVAHAEYAWDASKHSWHLALHAALTVAAVMTVGLLARAILVAAMSTPGMSTPAEPWTIALRLARGLFLIGATIQCLLLVFDARYRDFPVALYALAFGGFVMAYLGGLPRRSIVEERVLARIVLITLPFIAWHEGLHNASAMLWCVVCVAGAVPIVTGQRDDGDHQRQRRQFGAVEN